MGAPADRHADLAAAWAVVAISIVVFGTVAIWSSRGWDAIAFYFRRLFAVGLTALVSIVLGAIAIKRESKKKEKAYLAILFSIIAVVAAFVLRAEQ